MIKNLVEQLAAERSLSREEYLHLLTNADADLLAYAAKRARETAHARFGTGIYLRGLIEITNHCRNNCYYCGIRRGNKAVERYSLTHDEILQTCLLGHNMGIKTFVLQGGENAGVNNRFIEEVVRDIRARFPQVAITLSLGEKSREVYQRFFDAGANRYLLRHETATEQHYAQLHPQEMSFANRMQCLETLKDIGFQTGTGMMIGSPEQTPENLADDIIFIHRLKPEMIGMGPYIPQKDTPFAHKPAGSLHRTLLLTSIFRLMFPQVLMPATTSLATLAPDGYEQGILAGANVIMLNLTPSGYRDKYAIYDNKRSARQEVMDEYNELTKRMHGIGYHFADSRGDHPPSIHPQGLEP